MTREQITWGEDLYEQVVAGGPGTAAQLDQLAALLRDHSSELGVDLADPAALGVLRLLAERAEAHDLAGDDRFVALVAEFGAACYAAM